MTVSPAKAWAIARNASRIGSVWAMFGAVDMYLGGLAGSWVVAPVI